MRIFRIAIGCLIGLTPLLSNAQKNVDVLPNIILSILQSDADNTPPTLGLRARQTTEFNEQTQTVVSVTTFNYDELGRAQNRVKQRFIDGQEDGQTTTSIEYDAGGRTESSSSVSTNVAGEQTSIVSMAFSYVPSENNLRQVTTLTMVDSMSSSTVQEFDYDSSNRVSQVMSTLTTPTQMSTVVATPTYTGERIGTIARTITTPSGSTTDTLDLEYNETEHTSTTGMDSQSDLEAFLSGVMGTEIIRIRVRSLGLTLTNTTEYESGLCDASNEASRRLADLFSSETQTGGLGRRCR